MHGLSTVVVGYSCNNNCRHCPVARKRSGGMRPIKDVLDELASVRAKCVARVTISGGEPTIHPSFLDILTSCNELGFRQVIVRTNGRMFAYPGLAEDAAKARQCTFAVGVHGDDARTHAKITRVEESFDQTMQGLDNLLASGNDVFVTSTISRLNLDNLPGIVELARDHGISEVEFGFPRPVGNALAAIDTVVPTLTEARPHVFAAIRKARETGVGIVVRDMPYCILTPHQDVVGIAVEHPAGTHANPFPVSTCPEQGTRDKGQYCVRCRYNGLCYGVWHEYANYMGTDELRPQVKEDLR